MDQLLTEDGVGVKDKWSALNELMLYGKHLSNDAVESLLKQEQRPENIDKLITPDGAGEKKKCDALKHLMMYSKHLDIEGLERFMNERKP